MHTQNRIRRKDIENKPVVTKGSQEEEGQIRGYEINRYSLLYIK